MHERVEESEEGGVAAWRELHAKPHGHGHDAVMDHVQGRDVVELFAQHEEELEKVHAWVSRAGCCWMAPLLVTCTIFVQLYRTIKKLWLPYVNSISLTDHFCTIVPFHSNSWPIRDRYFPITNR